MKTRIALLAAAFVLPWAFGPGGGVNAQQSPPGALDSVLNRLTFRNIGPFRPGAWITEIAVPDTPAREHLYTIYAASRTGGLWKTVNNGITWQVITDSIEVASVGAVAVAPSNSQIVWLGTGEQANARSSYSGKGVFKSVDAGATWQFMGLPDSHHIARIVIHPKNPDMVWVAAMGHLFSRNEERGVFRTTDGGKSWQKVLYVDDGTGATDLVINRQSPNILYAAMYEKHRMPWQLVLGGPGTGLYRSDDGGVKWQKLAGGLPTGTLGRIGIDIYQKNPNLLYAVVENVNPRPPEMGAAIDGCQTPAGRGRGGTADDADPPGPGDDATSSRRAAAAAASPRIGNEIYRSDDGGKTWRKTHGHDVDVAGGKAPYSFNQLKIDTGNPDHLVVTSDQMYSSRDGGKTWACTNSTGFFRGIFGDFRTIWWDAEDPNRIMLGERRRRQRLVRRRPDGDGVRQQGARRGLRDWRRHGRSLQRLRRAAGPRLVDGAVERQVRPHHARSLDDGRAGRRHVQPGRSHRLALGLQHARDGQPRPLRSDDRRAHGDRAAGAAGSDAALQLGRADRALAAQSADALRGLAVPASVDEPRRRVGGRSVRISR